MSENGEYLKRALDLAPRIREAAPAIESMGQLPPELVRELAESGMFRLLLPRSLGGAQLELPDYLEIIQVIGEADGSTGWCVSQGAVYADLAPAFSDETAQEIWGRDPCAVVATGVPLRSELRRHKDGYRLSGHWRFASGCLHAGWLSAMAPLRDDPPPGGGLAGPGTMYCLIPRSDVTVIDAWDVRGMRGTGTHEYTVDDLPIPAHRVIPMARAGSASGIALQLLFASGFAAVGLGIARRAMDEFEALAQGKTPVFSQTKLRDEPLVQSEIAHAEAIWGSARAFLLEQAREVCESIRLHGQADRGRRARLRLAATHAMRQSGAAVERTYNLAGTDGIFADHPLQRCFQDIHALTQQHQGRPLHYMIVGQQLLGLAPRDGRSF